MKYIDAEDLLDQLNYESKKLEAEQTDQKVIIGIKGGFAMAMLTVLEMPRPQAVWWEVDEKGDAYDCSECGAMVEKPTNYCPRCGRWMGGDTE